MSPHTPGPGGRRQDPAKENGSRDACFPGSGVSEHAVGREGLGEWLEIHLLNEFTYGLMGQSYSLPEPQFLHL